MGQLHVNNDATPPRETAYYSNPVGMKGGSFPSILEEHDSTAAVTFFVATIDASVVGRVADWYAGAPRAGIAPSASSNVAAPRIMACEVVGMDQGRDYQDGRLIHRAQIAHFQRGRSK